MVRGDLHGRRREPHLDPQTALRLRAGGERGAVGCGDRLHDRKAEAVPLAVVGAPAQLPVLYPLAK